MAGEDGDRSGLSPDEAFATLGNETRVGILRALGEAGEPLGFSELRSRVGTLDSGRFNYHLDKLTGQFVHKTDEGYRLSRAGRRVVEAVLSGVVTDAPVVDPTPIDRACQYCGAPVAVAVREDRVVKYCTECSGAHGDPDAVADPTALDEYGYVGTLALPPAGVEGRTLEEVHDAAWTWANLEFLADASGVCSRCSARLERSPRLCEDHDASDGLCERCGDRHAIGVAVSCTNCINTYNGPLVLALVASTELLDFLTDHGLNPVSPGREAVSTVDRVQMDYDERIRSTDPFEAAVTFTVEGDSLTLVVDGDLSVVEARR